MDDSLGNIIRNICRLLEKHNVQYMLIGGTAVALHGYFRHSVTISGEITNKPDIDIWFNPIYENYYNILNVIEELGQNIDDFKKENNPNPHKSFFKLEFDDFTFDILPSIKADISFIEANRRKELVELEDTKIYFMNYRDLILDKEASARKKDIDDIENLKKFNKKK